MSRPAPKCLQCSKPLRKRTKLLWCKPAQDEYDKPSEFVGYAYGKFYTPADCQRVVNQQVVSVRYGSKRHDEDRPHISRFTTWDGQSYQRLFGNTFFCSLQCAGLYGTRAARRLFGENR